MKGRTLILTHEQVVKGKAHSTWVNEVLAHFGYNIVGGMVVKSTTHQGSRSVEKARYADLAKLPKHDLLRWLER